MVVGLDHETEPGSHAFRTGAPVAGIYDGLPEAFVAPVLEEPAFTARDVSYALWREPGDAAWRRGSVAEDGGAEAELELLLADDPRTYADLGAHYWDTELDPAAVARVYALEPLSRELVRALAPDANFADVRAAVAAIGYPL